MRAPTVLLALAAACLSACADPSSPSSPSSPQTNLNLSVVTTGIDQDPDGYVVFIGDHMTRQVLKRATLGLILEPGTYELRIADLAPNCSVQGPATASVTITDGAPTEAEFRVECRSVTGVMEVQAPTSGRDYPLAGYSIAVTALGGGSWLITALANGATDVVGLAPGQYELRFAQSEGNCSPSGEATRTVAVTAGGLTRDTARVAFAVTCPTTTGDVRLNVGTTGNPLWGSWTVSIDGVLMEEDWGDGWGIGPVYVSKNDSHLFERVAPGDHTLALGDLPPNCSVGGPHPRTVSVIAGAVSEVSLSVVCGP